MKDCAVLVSSRRSSDGGQNWGPVIHHELGTLGTIVFDKTTGAIIVQV